jgi:hypothetical protein
MSESATIKTNVFLLPNGEEMEVKEYWRGQYCKVRVGVKYDTEDRAGDNVEVISKWDGYEILEESKMYWNHELKKEGYRTDYSVIAKRKDWEECETVKEYTTGACNTKESTKIEVLLICDEYKRRIFRVWTGSNGHGCTLGDILDDIVDDLYEGFCEGENGAEYNEDDDSVSIDMYTDNGDREMICLKEFPLKDMIVSIRIVEFKSEIVD